MLDMHTSMVDGDIHNMETGKPTQALNLAYWDKIATLEHGINFPHSIIKFLNFCSPHYYSKPLLLTLVNQFTAVCNEIETVYRSSSKLLKKRIALV